MKASEELIEKIKEFEGYSNTAYRCAAGVWTCGWGHVRGVTATTTCVKSEAERWLKEDLAPVEAYVGTIGQVRTQGQFDALVDFAYNVGCDALGRSTLLKKIRSAAPDAEVRAEFMRWVHATVAGKKVKLEGLVKRRQWEADRYFNMV